MEIGITTRRRRKGMAVVGSLIGTAIVGSNCFPPVEITPPPADAPAEMVALTGASVVLAVGDIAVCNSPYDEATARLVDSVIKADSAAGVSDAIITVGDHVYPTGARPNWDRCWAPSWGDSAKRIMRVMRPSIGNHDLSAGFGAAYYEIFGEKAGDAGKGFYAYDLGVWRMIALNSEIVTNPAFSPEMRREQEAWLRQELQSNAKRCTIAYMHRPRFSSGGHAGDLRMTGVWNIMYEHNVDIVIAGHEHHYERFYPQTPAGLRDTVRGITQFIVGTGGANLTGIRVPVQPNSATRIQGHYGVLKLTLGDGEFQHAFLDITGRVWDRAAGKCH
ncbi:MAG TPA: metallophosphoesterase [Gemmatimonadaceae bacterium]